MELPLDRGAGKRYAAARLVRSDAGVEACRAVADAMEAEGMTAEGWVVAADRFRDYLVNSQWHALGRIVERRFVNVDLVGGSR